MPTEPLNDDTPLSTLLDSSPLSSDSIKRYPSFHRSHSRPRLANCGRSKAAERFDIRGRWSSERGWLAKRRAVVKEPERAEQFGLKFPWGVLLLGVPGCGKSLAAKAVANEWNLPLLKLDPSNLCNKYVGESESNFKRAMRAAERMAPVVLWIDELEKAFAPGGGEDGGVSQRILGSFLSWMQERTGDVFVVATANDIQSLPPEFLRKGRFDEIFFVDLPNRETSMGEKIQAMRDWAEGRAVRAN